MLQDFRLALRRLGQSPAWTLAAVGVLALGLGVGTTVFAVVDALVFEPPRVAEPERLLNIFAGGDEGRSGVTDYEPMAYADVRDLRRSARLLGGVTAYAPTTVTIETAAIETGPGGSEGFGSVAEVVERNYFDVLGLTPASGRFFDPDEDACAIAVLGRRLHSRLGDVSAGGLRVNGLPVTAVGVAPEGFRGLLRGLEPEIWLPMDCARELRFDQARNVQLGRATAGLDRFEDRGLRWVWAVARLREGVSPDAAGRDVTALGDRLARDHPATNRGRGFLTSSTADLRVAPDIDRRLEAASAGSLAVAVCVLLVACGNVAALLLIRSQGRRRELAARRALGAGTLRILRLLWVEGGILAALGTVSALALGTAATFGLRRLDLPVPIPIDLSASIGGETLVFAITAAFITSLLFVSAPALEHLRADIASALRTGVASTSVGGLRPNLLLAVSVTAQVAVSLALWITAATAGQSLLQADRVDPGCRPEGVVTARFDLGLQGFDDAERADVHSRVADAVSRLPGLRSFSYASHLPLSMELLLTHVASRPGADEGAAWAADRALVDVGYFEALGVDLLAGRGFTAAERDEARSVAVVNLAFAHRVWEPDLDPGDALGRRFWQLGEAEPLRVVGVTGTGRYRGLAEDERSFFYRPLPRGAAGARVLLARFGPDAPASRQGLLGQTLARTEPRLIVQRLETAEDAMAASLFVPRTAAVTLASFSTLALLLAAAGLYGVLGHSVALRRREIGIRMAVGGSPSRVAMQVVSGRILQVLVGLGLGLLLGLSLSNQLETFVHVGGAWQARSVFAASAVVLTVASLAGMLPARRAARTDPARVLRGDG